MLKAPLDIKPQPNDLPRKPSSTSSLQPMRTNEENNIDAPPVASSHSDSGNEKATDSPIATSSSLVLSAIEPDSYVEHLTVLDSSVTSGSYSPPSGSYSLPSGATAGSPVLEAFPPDPGNSVHASTTEISDPGDFLISSTTGSRFTAITADPFQQWPDALMYAHMPIPPHGISPPFMGD